ncbi:uncharacterized protein [Oscarella lobularis]|uniref:uncharacterized protein n=1 Tax=Oscarella lobularis TaxID=121494 RepID=UPI0033140254
MKRNRCRKRIPVRMIALSCGAAVLVVIWAIYGDTSLLDVLKNRKRIEKALQASLPAVKSEKKGRSHCSKISPETEEKRSSPLMQLPGFTSKKLLYIASASVVIEDSSVVLISVDERDRRFQLSEKEIEDMRKARQGGYLKSIQCHFRDGHLSDLNIIEDPHRQIRILLCPMSDLMLDCLKNADESICFEFELRSKSVSPDRPLAAFSLCSEPVKQKYLLTMCSQPITPHIWTYIPQWIDYHHRLGIEHFYLYAANSTKEKLTQFLKSYIDKDIVCVQSWMSQQWIGDEVHVRQISSQNDCIYRHKDASTWIGFFDVDEYLYSEKEVGLHDLLKSYNDRVTSGLQFKSVFFQREEKPGSLIIENYQRSKYVLQDTRQKYFCRPKYTKITSVHLTTLGEEMIPIDESILRINHYRAGFSVSQKDRVEDMGMRKYVTEKTKS